MIRNSSSFVVSVCCVLLFVSVHGKEGVTYNNHRNLAFRENKGQVTDQTGAGRDDIYFQLSTEYKSVFIGADKIHYQWNKMDLQDTVAFKSSSSGPPLNKIESYRLDMWLVGANPNAIILKEDVLPDVDIYYQHGLNGVRAASFRKITYKDIYPNIDWVLYIKNNSLKYDFVVRPGGNTNDIKMQYEGATSIFLDDGAAVITTPMGKLRESKPYSFHQQDGSLISSRFLLKDNVLSFETGKRNGTLVIDPELRLDWGTYFGGSGIEGGQYLMNTFQGYYAYGNTVTTDHTGAVYLSGTTASVDNIATTGAYQVALSFGNNAFLARFDNEGNRLWSTYFSGFGFIDEGTVSGRGHSVVCDTIGNVYMAGNTFCDSGIATTGAYQQYRNSNGYGWPDLYLVKFKNDGTREWSTYYGNPRIDEGGSLAVKPDGSRIYLAGASQSYSPSVDAIATPNAYIGPVTIGNAAYSGFLACFNATGQRQWGTYIADVSNIISSVYDLALDKQGNIFLTGYAIGDYAGNTHSISSPGSYQPQYSGCVISPFFPPSCMTDAFLQKWDSDGNRLWGTYYGGNYPDGGYAVACDEAGDVYMTGFTSPFTNANNGPYSVASQGSFMDVFPTEGGAYLAKFSGTGQRLWATYYYGQGIGLACADDKVFFLVNTAIDDAATPCAHQTDNSGIFATGSNPSSLLTIFNTSGIREYATYYGGKYNDWGSSLAAVKANDDIHIYTAGNTLSPSGIATPGSFKSALGSQLSIQRDAYVARFVMPQPKRIKVPCFSSDSVLITATDTSYDSYEWNDGSVNKSIWVKNSGLYTVHYAKPNGCMITDSFWVTIYPMPQLTTTQGCIGQGIATMHLETENNGVYTYKWYRSSGELIEEISGSDYVAIDSLQAGNYTCRILTPDCDTIVSFTIETFADIELTISNDTLIAAGHSVVLSASGANLYRWQPEQWLDDPRSANPEATPEAPITYTVTGYNKYGCKASKSVRIDINEGLFIPNAFSPNGDGINDEFKIGNYGYQKLEEFRIFNRWGQEVFYTTDPGKGWGGNYNSKQADMGTYHYYIRLLNPKGAVQTLKGSLTLIH